MIVPRLLLEGRVLYRDIRCFYGPLGYWINAALGWAIGTGPDAVWLAGALRFGLMLALLWQLARRLLTPRLAALAMTFGAYGLFFSFVTPYSAGIGWGALLLVGGLLCLARTFSAEPVGDTDEPRATPAGASIRWSIAAAALFSLAAATKQEYAFAAASLVALLMGDHLLRPRLPGGRTKLLAIVVAAVLPFALIAAVVLVRVPAAVLLHENLWIPELMDHVGGGASYCLEYLSSPARLTALVELTALLTVAVAVVTIVASANGRRRMWIVLIASAVIAGVAEWYARSLPHSAWNVFNYPKPRLRELIEASPMLCLPLSFVVIAIVARQMWKTRSAAAWNQTTGGYRLGIACGVVYLSFTMREIPGAAGLLRQPLTPILLAWLLASVVPQCMRWQGTTTRFWGAGVSLLLLAGTAFGVDNMRFYQMRPGTWLEASCGSMYAWQRRQPFTPKYFAGALQLVESHREVIGGGSLVCVPEGAWVNAMTNLRWGTRDTQWMPYLEPWIAQDMKQQPPGFVLTMESLEALKLPAVAEMIHENYRVLEANECGMTLYQRVDGREEPARAAATGDLQ